MVGYFVEYWRYVNDQIDSEGYADLCGQISGMLNFIRTLK